MTQGTTEHTRILASNYLLPHNVYVVLIEMHGFGSMAIDRGRQRHLALPLPQRTFPPVV